MNAPEPEHYEWEYTHRKNHIKLYKADKSFGTLTVERDLEGKVLRGKVLSLDPTEVNLE
jgi:hypothetical protein